MERKIFLDIQLKIIEGFLSGFYSMRSGKYRLIHRRERDSIIFGKRASIYEKVERRI